MKNNLLESEIERFKNLLYHTRSEKTGLLENNNKSVNNILDQHKKAIQKEWSTNNIINESVIKEIFLISEEPYGGDKKKTKKEISNDVNTLIAEVEKKWNEKVKDLIIWRPMLEWFKKNPKNPNTLTSLQTLVQSSSVDPKNYSNNIKKQNEILQEIDELLGTLKDNDPKKPSLQNLKNLINSFAQKNIALKGKDNNYGYVSALWFKTMDDPYGNFSTKTASDIDKVRVNLAKAYEGEKGSGGSTGSFEMDDQDILNVLNDLQTKVSKKLNQKRAKGNKKITFEKLVSRAISIKIKPGVEKINSSEFKNDIKNAGETVYTDKKIQFPPSNLSEDERKTLGKNFMKDDSDSIGPGVAEIMSKLLSDTRKDLFEMKSQYKSMQISYVNIFAYASTSCVRTKYKAKFFSKDNNKKLAEDRAERIMGWGSRSLINSLSNFDKKVADKTTLLNPTVQPNVGPEWESVGGTYANGEQVVVEEAYGPLFLEAYKKYKKLTPQQFYGMRDESAAKYVKKLLGREVTADEVRTEYENTYEPYRMSVLVIQIGIEAQEQEEKWAENIEYEAAYSNEYTATITWKPPWKPPKIRIDTSGWFRYRPKPKVFVPRWTCPTCCPGF